MKKKSFLNGLYAKGALALTIVAGFTLAGCEKEEFRIDVPDINVSVPEVVVKPGVVAVTLSATSASGNTLEDVTFTVNGTAVTETTFEYTDKQTLSVKAEKSGYNSVVKTVNVPTPAEGTYNIIPVSFVLSAVEEVVLPDEGDDTPIPGEAQVQEEETKTYADAFEANKSYTLDVAVPTGSYYTPALKNELLRAVEDLTAPDAIARAAGDEEAQANLLIAKKNLRATIDALPTKANTKLVPVTFTLTDAAKSVTFSIQTTSDVCAVTFATKVAGLTYSVEGKRLVVANNEIKATAEGVEIDHGHGHGHGNGGNAGGGITGKN